MLHSDRFQFDEIKKLLERKNIAISSRNKIRVPCGGSSYFAFPKRIANLPAGSRMISSSILEKILRIFVDDGIKVERKVELYEHQTVSLQEIQKRREAGIKAFFDCAAYSRRENRKL